MKKLHHGSDQIYLKSTAGDALALSARAGGREEHAQDRRDGGGHRLAHQQADAAELRGSGGHKPKTATSSSWRARVSRNAWPSFSARGLTVERPAYDERLALECEVIAHMGFPGYFLIVQDFINWGEEQRACRWVRAAARARARSSPTRCGITDLDPIPYNLLFERFLNPERVSMPDFDVDFCMDRRDEVIDYVRGKYGETSVGQIATFHLLKSRSVVRDVGRVMGMSPAGRGAHRDAGPRAGAGQERAHHRRARAGAAAQGAVRRGSAGAQSCSTPRKTLEGLTRHAGMHAAGVVISEGPLWDHVPVFCPEEDVYVTQYDKDDVEAAGLVKFDFLGLKTLTVIDIAARLIDKRPDRDGSPFDIDRDPARRRGHLRALAVRRDDERVPARVERHAGAVQAAQAGLLRGHRRRRRALPPGPARHRAWSTTSSSASTAARRSSTRTRARGDPRGHLRRHRLPGAGDADRPARWRATRSAAPTCSPRDGQEEGRGDGEAEAIFLEGALKNGHSRGATPRASSS